jgi:cytochrome b6-f complex iron-sulfur subunit
MKRRSFLSWVGAGTLATSLPVALAACNSEGQDNVTTDASAPTAPEPDLPVAEAPEVATDAPEDSFVPVGAVADLDSQGFIANQDLSAGPVIVIRDPSAADSLIALDSRCPHRGCAVEWQAADNQFLCPCHQSAFEPDGSVVAGPATTSLNAFEAKIEADQVLVKTT